MLTLTSAAVKFDLPSTPEQKACAAKIDEVNDRLTRLYSAQQDAVPRPTEWDGICVMVGDRRSSGYGGALDLGRVIPLGRARFPQFAPFRGIKVPRQERSDILRDLAPGRRAVLEVPRQPSPRIELPQRYRGEDREQRRRLLPAPERARAIEV